MAAIQVKHVPEELHDELRARAEAEGKTISAYLLELIRRDLRKPRFKAWVEELQKLPPVERTDIDSGELIAEIRAEKVREDEELADRIAQRHGLRESDGPGSH